MGDKQNTIKKLQSSVKSIKFADKLDFEQVSNGQPKEFLKLYQYLFCEYSPVISAEVTGKHQVELAGKEDKPFMECVYRLIRDMFDYVPKLTRDQFFTTSYAQAKATMAIEIIDLVQKKLKTPQPAGSSSSSSSAAVSVSVASSALLSSTHDGPLNTSGNGPATATTTSTTKPSKTNLKSEHSFKNGVSKPSANNRLPPKASKPTTNGSTSSSSEMGSKLEGLMSRLELVEKYCQEISREKPQSKESRTFKDDAGDDEIVHGDGDIDLQAVKSQTNGIDKHAADDMPKNYYEPQVTREEFERVLDRLGNVERNLFNIELKQNIMGKKLDDYLAKQEERKALRRNNSFSE